MFDLHYQIIEEEKFLKTKYGPAFENYIKKVRRYV